MKHISNIAKKAVNVINKTVITSLIDQNSYKQPSVIEDSDFILKTLSFPSNDQLLHLKNAFNRIHHGLLVELNSSEPHNLIYLIQSDFWINFPAAVSNLLPASFISESLKFCGYFINKDLSCLYSYSQIIHGLSNIFNKLESLYFKDPDGVISFIKEIWSKILSTPTILNFMVFYQKNPVLDFFADTVLSLNEAGILSRTVTASFFANDLKFCVSSDHRNYLFEKVFPQIITLMSFVCQCVSTISHKSEIFTLFPWVDTILSNNPDFDCSKFLNGIDLNGSSKNLQIFKFIFDNFHAYCLIHPIFISIFQKLNLVINDLSKRSKDRNIDENINSSIADLLSLLHIAIESKSYENLLPPVSQHEIFDIFTLNDFGLESLEDGISFPQFKGKRVGEPYFFNSLMNLLSFEESLSDSIFEQFTNDLGSIFISAPDLIDQSTCNSITECFQKLQTERMPENPKISCIKKLAQKMHYIVFPPRSNTINEQSPSLTGSHQPNESKEEKKNDGESKYQKNLFEEMDETNIGNSNVIDEEYEKSTLEEYEINPGAYD